MDTVKELKNTPGYREYLDKNGVRCEAIYRNSSWDYYFYDDEGIRHRHGFVIAPYDATCEQIENDQD
jgi:hypothetical protein